MCIRVLIVCTICVHTRSCILYLMDEIMVPRQGRFYMTNLNLLR